MPKLILRCNYLKNAPPSHLANYMNYISTREGVEKIDNTCGLLPATVKQKELIADILSKIEDADRMHEYYDYLQKPTRENATEFITQALENNLDIIAKKKNYIDYLANRPRVERIGTHGLFSNEGESIALSRVAEEVANHPGVIWTNVISLRREDAERLGYDSAAQWQALLRSRVELLCENYKIDSRNLKWYAAFHNESHHPHVHLVVYSTNPSEGYLSPKGIDTMRSTYAHDIFRQEFMSIYEKRTQQREQLKEQANESLLFLLQQMQSGICHNEKVAEQMRLLSKRLMNTGGKKVYGYLKADVKAIVNGIVDELAKEEKVAECYLKWLESKSEILHFYKDADAEQLPLSEQKELKSIKNMVIREAVRYGEGYLYTEDEGLEDLETEREEMDADDSEVLEDMVEASADDFSDEPETEDWDEVGTIPKIESAEMMFSASRSRRVSIVPMIQSFAQLNKNYGKEGAEINIDNCQDTIFGGFAPNSESAEVLSKSLGNKTVMSGSISRGKNDPSQSLQMIQRPLMTPDELKSLPKGNFIVSKTGSHPMRTKLKLFLKWGITFEEPYEIEEKSARKVAYADKQEIEEEIIRRYMCCVDEEPESTEQGTASRSGGMLQSQMNETVAKVRQALRTED